VFRASLAAYFSILKYRPVQFVTTVVESCSL